MQVEKVAYYDIRADQRGQFLGVITGSRVWREANLFITRIGASRGHHYSPAATEFFFLIKGAAHVTLFHISAPADVAQFIVRAGEGFIVPPNVVRTFVYEEDGEALTLRDIPYHESGPDVAFP